MPVLRGISHLKKTTGSTFMVECVNQMCRLQVKSYARETEEAAIELWNTRAEESKAESEHDSARQREPPVAL